MLHQWVLILLVLTAGHQAGVCGESAKLEATEDLAELPVVIGEWPATIAVLPVHNYSMAEETAVMFRRMLEDFLPEYGYLIIKPSHVDKICAELGIEKPGDVQLVDVKELGNKLNATFLFEGSVLGDAKKRKLYLNTKSIHFEVKIISVHTGTVYTTGEKYARRCFNADPINALLTLIDTSDMNKDEHAEKLVRLLLQKLPKQVVAPVEQIFGDVLLDRAITVDAVVETEELDEGEQQ